MKDLQDFDYRKELKSVLAERQCRNKSYSIRALARDLQLSVTALHGVLKGTRHLSKKNLESLSLTLGWSQQKFNIALNSNKQIEDLTESILEEDRFSMIADWVHLAVLNLAKIPSTKAAKLHQRLGIDKAHCDQVIKRLQRLDFIEIKGEKIFRKEPSFGTSQDRPSRAIRAFHYKNIIRAQEALDSTPVEERDFLTIAAATNKQQIVQVKKLIQEFRKKVLQTLETPHPDEVYFLNVQLYPVTGDKNKEIL